MPGKLKLTILCFILAVLSGCTVKEPAGISAFAPDYPGTKPTITRSQLKVNENYTVGYTNGKIRSSQVTLNWAKVDVDDFLCYKLYRDDQLDPIKTWTNKNTLTFTDTALVPDSFYGYKIAALNTSGMYTTDTVRVKTLLFDPPDNIIHTILIDTTVTPRPRSVVLRWVDNAEYSTGFEIERSINLVSFTLLGSALDTTYTDASMGADSTSTFFYRIRTITPYEKTLYSSSHTVNMY